MFDQLDLNPHVLTTVVAMLLVAILVASTVVIPVVGGVANPLEHKLGHSLLAGSVASGKSRRRGTIEKRGENKWLVRVDLGAGPDGKRRRRSKIVHGPRQVAERELTKMLRQADEEQLRSRHEIPRTIEDLFAEYLGPHAEDLLRPNTVKDYRRKYRIYIRPHLGDKRLDRLKPDDIRSYISLLMRKPKKHAKAPTRRGPKGAPRGRGAAKKATLSVNTVHAAVKLLKAGLKYAYRNNYTVTNIGEVVRNVRRVKPKIIPLKPAERDRLLEAAKNDPNHWIHYPYLLLLAQTGLRPAEALALSWSSIDWESDEIHVTSTLLYENKEEYELEENLKTDSSHRAVPMTEKLKRVLQEHELRQRELNMCDPDLDLVFADEHGRPLDARHMVNKVIKVLAREAGVRKNVTNYIFRHGFGTDGMKKTKDATTIAKLMGHSSTRTTQDNYDHPDEERLKSAVQVIAGDGDDTDT